MAPGEICILIYLSYILYISKFFIPLQWLHASFMGSSAVFAGQIQTHFTRHAAAAAARLFHLGCVGWMQNLLSGVVNFFFFFLLTPPSLWRCQCEESPPHRLVFPTFSLASFWFVSNFENCKRSISLTWKRLFCWGWVTDTIRWIWKWCVDATHRASHVKTNLLTERF